LRRAGNWLIFECQERSDFNQATPAAAVQKMTDVLLKSDPMGARKLTAGDWTNREM